MKLTKAIALTMVLLMSANCAQASLDDPLLGVEEEEEKLPKMPEHYRKALYKWYREEYDVEKHGFFPKRKHYEKWLETLEKEEEPEETEIPVQPKPTSKESKWKYTKEMRLADEYIEHLEGELRDLFPGYQLANFRSMGMIENFLKEYLRHYYRPNKNAPKMAEPRKIERLPPTWKSKAQYIAAVLIPDLKAVFGIKNIKGTWRNFTVPEKTAQYIKKLIDRYYTKIPTSERVHKIREKVEKEMWQQ